jgi:hypothetical protein
MSAPPPIADAMVALQARLRHRKANRAELRAKVAYRGFTTAGELRHASFKGLREQE